MVKHIILWNLKEEYSEQQKAEILVNIKKEIEGLKGKVPGLIDIRIQTEKLPSSSCDVMLYSELESADALKAYAVHPDHVYVADTFVRPFVANRSCIDFEA